MTHTFTHTHNANKHTHAQAAIALIDEGEQRATRKLRVELLHEEDVSVIVCAVGVCSIGSNA